MPIQSGFFTFDSGTYPQLLDNNPPGDRQAQDYINFPTPFATAPIVVVSINRIDSGASQNLRIRVLTDTVNTSGFELLASTWWDSQIYSVGVSWIAYTN